MKTTFILIFIAVFIFFDNSLGYTACSAWYTHITYNFQHANVWHLLINSVAFFFVFRNLQRYIPPYKIVLLSLPVAIVCSLFTAHYSLPIVGASGMIFAMIGMLFSFAVIKAINYPKAPRKSLYISLVCFTIVITIGFFQKNTAGMLHLLCLVGGFVAMSLLSLKSLISFNWIRNNFFFQKFLFGFSFRIFGYGLRCIVTSKDSKLVFFRKSYTFGKYSIAFLSPCCRQSRSSL